MKLMLIALNRSLFGISLLLAGSGGSPGVQAQCGVASFYGDGFHGRKTANGESYNKHADTAAHRKLPFNTEVMVKNLDNGKATTLRINDRGPYVAGRIIDLSEKAAEVLDVEGLTKVCVEPVKEAVNALGLQHIIESDPSK